MSYFLNFEPITEVLFFLCAWYCLNSVRDNLYQWYFVLEHLILPD